MMKLLSILAALSLICLSGSATFAEGFGVKEYDEFHHVLHQLQHEALPKNDMATIRTKANELIQLGHRITSLGVPQGTKPEHVDSFKKELARFDQALAKYGADAKSGNDEDLRKSYVIVHDSFENLAEMLPARKS
jgi:DNA-binding LacI/PurR family transcriptional regulator